MPRLGRWHGGSQIQDGAPIWPRLPRECKGKRRTSVSGKSAFGVHHWGGQWARLRLEKSIAQRWVKRARVPRGPKVLPSCEPWNLRSSDAIRSSEVGKRTAFFSEPNFRTRFAGWGGRAHESKVAFKGVIARKPSAGFKGMNAGGGAFLPAGNRDVSLLALSMSAQILSGCKGSCMFMPISQPDVCFMWCFYKFCSNPKPKTRGSK